MTWEEVCEQAPFILQENTKVLHQRDSWRDGVDCIYPVFDSVKT